MLTINDAVPAQIDGGTTISFRVSDFLNPISTTELTGFWLATFDAEGGTIDDSREAATELGLRVTTPAQITGASLVA